MKKEKDISNKEGTNDLYDNKQQEDIVSLIFDGSKSATLKKAIFSKKYFACLFMALFSSCKK